MRWIDCDRTRDDIGDGKSKRDMAELEEINSNGSLSLSDTFWVVFGTYANKDDNDIAHQLWEQVKRNVLQI